MGLDMYIYRCSKPDLKPNKVYDSAEISDIMLTEEELKEQMYREIGRAHV